jgi:hypothetical protein
VIPEPTADDLDRDLERDYATCEAATGGPWDHIDGCNDDSPGHYSRYVGPKAWPVLWAHGSNREANCNFASVARTALPAALRLLAAARRENERLRALLAEEPKP